MISLARANLIHDWRRHATAVIVLVLAGLLMTIQLGLVLGFSESFGELQRQLRADIVVQRKPSANGFFGGRVGIESRHEGLIWMHPEVADVQQHNDDPGRSNWYREDTGNNRVLVNTIDPSAGSMTFPRRFPESLRKVLATPGVVVLPRESARSLGASLGDKAKAGDVEVIVGGIVNGLSGSFRPSLFVSPQTSRLINSNSRGANSATMFLVRLEDASRVDRVIEQLNSTLAGAGLRASKPEEVASSEGLRELLDSSFGWILLGSSAFALVVGCGIASQTLRGAFLAQIKEFGALRALGVRRSRLAMIALEQAWWTGLVSIPIAALIAHAIRLLAVRFDVTIALSLELMVASSVLLLFVALFAGVISLPAVSRADPAELLR